MSISLLSLSLVVGCSYTRYWWIGQPRDHEEEEIKRERAG